MTHEHNRLLTSVVLDASETQAVARAHSQQLSKAQGPVVLILPEHGLGEWDREGADLHNPHGLAAFLSELEVSLPANVELHRVGCHINDAAFADRVLMLLDAWCADGTLKGPERGRA